MTNPDSGNGWSEWKNYVLRNQEEHSRKLDELLLSVKQLEIEMSAQKVKSGVLGTIAGLFGGAVAGIARGLMGGDK